MPKEKLWTAPFLCMGGINFFQFLTQYILVSTLPLFIIAEFGGSDVQAGLAMTSFQIGTSLFRPFAGYLIDKKNKRQLLLLALVLFNLVMLAFNFLAGLEEIFVLRAFHGVLFSLTTTTAAAIAVLVIPPSRRGEGVGYFAVTTNLAMVVGPLAGLLLYQLLGISVLFLFLSLAAAAMLLGAFLVPLAPSVTAPQDMPEGPLLERLLEIKSLPAALLGGLVYFAYGGVLTFIPLYLHSLSMDSQTGVFFAVFALSIVVSRPVIGRLFDSLGPVYLILPGFAAFILGLVLFSQITTPSSLYAAAVVQGLGFGALSPSFQTLAIQSAPLSRAGAATATFFWFLDILVGIAAATLGLIAGAFGYTLMYGLVCPAVEIAAALLYLYWHFRKQLV